MKASRCLKISIFAVVTLFLLYETGCSRGLASATNLTGPGCTVTSVSQVSGTSQVALSVSAYGGTPNYSISSISINSTQGTLVTGSPLGFDTMTTVTESFDGIASSILAGASGSVTVVDSSQTAQTLTCTFSVPSGSLSDLSCSLMPSSTSPAVGSPVNFTFTGSGGIPPYTFSSFTPGDGGAAGAIQPGTDGTTATDTWTYSSAGSQTASVAVSDLFGNTGNCNASLTVGISGGGGGTTQPPGLTCGILWPTQSLSSGQRLTSCNGKYHLDMQSTDGNLGWYGPGGAIWGSNTSGGAAAVMQADGNFVVYQNANQTVRLFDTGTWGNPGSVLKLQDNGALIVVSPSGVPLWAYGHVIATNGTLSSGATLYQNQTIISGGGDTFLSLDTKGYIVLRSLPGIVWGYGTGTRLSMQLDGNLVLYDASNNPVWASNTPSLNGSYLVVRDDDGGQMLIYTNSPLPSRKLAWTNRAGALIQAGGILPSNGTIYAGHSLLAADGSYQLALDPDGNLRLIRPDGSIAWNAPNAGAHSYLVMQPAGNLVLYNSSNQPVWFNATYGTPNSWFVVQGDGNMVIYTPTSGHMPEWSSLSGQLILLCGGLPTGGVLNIGQSIYSCDLAYRLTLQLDGNLVAFRNSDGVPIWATATGTGARLLMSPGGNLQLFDASLNIVWENAPYGHAGASFTVQPDGNGVIYFGSTADWSWNTGQLFH